MGAYASAEPEFELTAQAMVALGPDYARVLTLGKEGATTIFITPKGHAELGRRLREHANERTRS